MLSQSQADYLLRTVPKTFVEQTLVDLSPPQLWSRELTGTDQTEQFILDFRRGSFEISKYTFNKRFHKAVVLARYDSVGRHTNPDGEIFDGPHIHLYREGYGDKFAFPVSEIGLVGGENTQEVCCKFFSYCNIANIGVQAEIL